jgi:hypothetical protein
MQSARQTGRAPTGAAWVGPTAGTSAESIAVLDDHGPFGVLDLAGAGRSDRVPRGPFRLRALNRCLLARRRIEGAHPDDRLPDGAFGTELRFPLDGADPWGAAICVMTSDRRFSAVLTEMAGVERDRAAEDVAHDAALLATLDALPAFEPWLVHTRLARLGLDPTLLLSSLAGETIAVTERLLAEHIRPALRAASAVRRGSRFDHADDAHLDRLWADEGIRSLSRLVERLGVPAPAVPAALDGWEALAVFALRRSQMRSLWDAMRASLAYRLRMAPVGGEWREIQGREPLERALNALDTTLGAVDAALGAYAGAYRATVLDHTAARPLATILADAAVTARQVGGLMVAVARATGCWRRHGGTIRDGGTLIGPPARIADQVARALVR